MNIAVIDWCPLNVDSLNNLTAAQLDFLCIDVINNPDMVPTNENFEKHDYVIVYLNCGTMMIHGFPDDEPVYILTNDRYANEIYAWYCLVTNGIKNFNDEWWYACSQKKSSRL